MLDQGIWVRPVVGLYPVGRQGKYTFYIPTLRPGIGLAVPRPAIHLGLVHIPQADDNKPCLALLLLLGGQYVMLSAYVQPTQCFLSDGSRRCLFMTSHSYITSANVPAGNLDNCIVDAGIRQGLYQAMPD